MNLFERYIGIDYSGAATDDTPLSGLRVYLATRAQDAVEVLPRWTRRQLAHWLVDQLNSGPSAFVGIDHGFSFPLVYFDTHALAKDWPAFLAHTPLQGNSRWRRIADIRARAKSVFHFGVPGSVAKSTHTGLPWLRHIRANTSAHFWPFDGWQLPSGRSVIAEAYPSLWSRDFVKPEGRTQDQHDAYSLAAKLRALDAAGELPRYANPPLDAQTRAAADIEGWIFGVL